MNLIKTLLAQLMEFVPWPSVARIVIRYGGDSEVRRLSCTEQFRAMTFAQLTYRESLRDYRDVRALWSYLQFPEVVLFLL